MQQASAVLGCKTSIAPGILLSQTQARYINYVERELASTKQELESEKSKRLELQKRLENCLEIPDCVANKSLEILEGLEESLRDKLVGVA